MLATCTSSPIDLSHERPSFFGSVESANPIVTIGGRPFSSSFISVFWRCAARGGLGARIFAYARSASCGAAQPRRVRCPWSSSLWFATRSGLTFLWAPPSEDAYACDA